MKKALRDRSIKRPDMVSMINNDEAKFNELIRLVLENIEPYAWLSAWNIKHAMTKNDARLVPFVSLFIDLLPNVKHSCCRELLNILEKMQCDEEQEGKLFDHAMNIWENINNQSSVRYKAFYILFSIIQKYPELKSEVSIIFEDRYLEDLSLGIRKGIEKKVKQLLKEIR